MLLKFTAQFIWDENKNRINLQKHGLNFADAEKIFLGKTITFLDTRKDYGETRFITLGELLKRTIVVIHTERGNTIRIISMRKANEREKKIYYERFNTHRPNARKRYRLLGHTST